jgi:integrase
MGATELLTAQPFVLSSGQSSRTAGREGLLMARRRYQSGTLFQRGKRNKVWVGRWLEDEYRGDTRARVRKSAVLGTVKELPTRKLAMRELQRRLAEVNSLTYQPAHCITFRELALKWKNTILPTHKPSGQSAEKAHVAHLTDFFGDMEARGITGEMVQRFVTQAATQHAPKYVRNMMITFRLIWKTAYDWGYVERDENAILRSVRLPDLGLRNQPCFTPEQARQIIEAAWEPFKTMFWLIAETGIRGGEICGLSVDDVDLEHRIICVRRSAWRGDLQTPKTPNAIRTFAISQNLAIHLQGYLKAQWKENPERLLFPNRKGEAFDNNDIVQDRLHPIMDRLGIPRPKRIGLHALRHGSATVLDELHAPIAVRKDRLGHASFATTLGYTHAVSRDHYDVADKLGPLFDPNCPKSVADVVESRT